MINLTVYQRGNGDAKDEYDDDDDDDDDEHDDDEHDEHDGQSLLMLPHNIVS